MRTLLSALAIGVQVTLILTLVGVSQGMLGDVIASRRGTGADIMIRPPSSSVLSFNIRMPEKLVQVVRSIPHVALATGTFIQPLNNGVNSIAGIHLDEFDAMSGGFKYLSGGPFTHPDDIVLDSVFARSERARVGGTLDLGGQWHVTGIVEPGKLSRAFADIDSLQKLYAATDYVTVIWVKVDNQANIPTVIQSLKDKLPDYKIDSMEEYISLISPDNIPMLKPFTSVVIGIAVIVGFLVVFLSMYMAVLERTREIGILKALGASPGYILGILLRETVLLAIAGTIAGILMSYGARWLMQMLVPMFTTNIVPGWWPYAGLIALIGSLIGALYPGFKAARQDPIEALAYD